MVSALRSIKVPFNSFDILTDEEVRQGLKEYSQWPTYPQLYVKGELLGGCDVILEMQQDGKRPNPNLPEDCSVAKQDNGKTWLKRSRCWRPLRCCSSISDRRVWKKWLYRQQYCNTIVLQGNTCRAAAAGELKHSIEEALGKSEPQSVEQRIHKLLKHNPVMLFMKGKSALCRASRVFCPARCFACCLGLSHLAADLMLYG